MSKRSEQELSLGLLSHVQLQKRGCGKGFQLQNATKTQNFMLSSQFPCHLHRRLQRFPRHRRLHRLPVTSSFPTVFAWSPQALYPPRAPPLLTRNSFDDLPEEDQDLEGHLDERPVPAPVFKPRSPPAPVS